MLSRASKLTDEDGRCGNQRTSVVEYWYAEEGTSYWLYIDGYFGARANSVLKPQQLCRETTSFASITTGA
jgi:hypothetical protein